MRRGRSVRVSAAYLIVLLLMMAAIRAAPESVQNVVRRHEQVSLRPRIGLPAEIRQAFIAPAAIAFATFALGGFYAALIPGLLSQSLHQQDPLLVGSVVCLFFGIGALGAAVSSGLHSRAALANSTVLMVLGLAALASAERLHSMPLLLLATILGGVAMALGFRSSLQIVNQIAPGEQRAKWSRPTCWSVIPPILCQSSGLAYCRARSTHRPRT